MSKYRRTDLSRIKTRQVAGRKTKSEVADFARPSDPTQPLTTFLDTLPRHLKACDLLAIAETIARARRDGRALIWMMGAHPIKVGLSPVLIDLVENGFVSHLAVNGAFAIHDLEMAFFGRTSEDVAEGLADGSFGMVEETPRLIFDAVQCARKENLGLGEGMGKYIVQTSPANLDKSILAACFSRDLPVTVHVAVGTDTICQHPGYDGAAFGELSLEDFKILCESVRYLSRGTVINIGSAVILPEVFLKALTVARNIYGKIDGFDAANFDMIQHYRPNTNVVSRPVSGDGKGYSFTGHHEIMIPLLAAAIKSKYLMIAGKA